MHTNHTTQIRKFRFWLRLPLLAILAVGLFSSPAIAKSGNSKLMDNIRVQFDKAIVNGDTARAKTIWASIDKTFDEKIDKLTAKSMVFGSGTINWQKTLNKLHTEQPGKFEKIALFLSSINLNFFDSTSGTATGSLSGKVSTYKGKGIANAKIVFTGHETSTNDKGEFSLSGLPEGTFDLLAFAPGYQIDGDRARTVTASKQNKLSIRLHASKYKPRQVSKIEARAKMKAAMTQLGKALTAAKPTGTETIQGTVVNEQSGEPIAGVKFMIAPSKKDASLSRIAITDKQGHFTLLGVHAGISEIVIIPKDTRYYLPFGQKVNLTGGGKTHRATWKLKPIK